MKREANPGKPTISSPLNERERQGVSLALIGRTAPKNPIQASDFRVSTADRCRVVEDGETGTNSGIFGARL